MLDVLRFLCSVGRAQLEMEESDGKPPACDFP